MSAAMPRELEPFVVDEVLARSLLALAAAESLTDPLAHDLLRVALGAKVEPTRFVRALHLCDFVVERNSEWHFAGHVREALIDLLVEDPELLRRLNSRLLELTKPTDETEKVPEELPRYLRLGVGRAYHGTYLSRQAIRGYVAVADQPLSGQQWLAGNLASEQVRVGVIPEDAVEVTFLRGMVLYREGRRREAERLLRKVARRPEQHHEVAVAAHLIGRIDGKRPRTQRQGEALLRKSLAILEHLNDIPGRAQVLHTLGQLIGREAGRRDEAEDLLRESLEIRQEIDERQHVAQVLHTLGQLIGREPGRRDEAEDLLRESLEFGQEVGNVDHQAQVLHTLGQLIGREPGRRDEAEDLLRESLEIEMTMDNALGRAQVLHTLGQLVGREAGRRDEAEDLLRESLEIGQEVGNVNHQAQVLYSLARLKGTPPEVARALLQESLDLNRQIHNKRGERIVGRALSRLPRNASA